MRLLQYSDTEGFTLTNPFASNEIIPPYAILSHTWGADAEEVTFNDLINGSAKEKPGYEKIMFCGEQARKDELQYFWIDTCCINRSIKAEISQAINSMFIWYQNASRCYVYLSDVSTAKRSIDGTHSEWEPAFRKSRWFTRGWTLQELLGPSSVEFFSRQGKRLGDKSSLGQQILEITAIPKLALEGTLMSHFSVNDRLSWIEHRHTKLEEDKAYSLLGIFGVYIPPLYGEGLGGAFRRLLDELNKLEKCTQDLHLTDPRRDKMRIEGIKGGLLADSYHWILKNSEFNRWRDDEESRLLWIKGDPGKGKTMLLCGIINELEISRTKTDVLSYFYCQATDSRANTATTVLRGLLYLLVDQHPSLVSYIRKKYDYIGKPVFEDPNSWLVLSEIFTDILEDRRLNRTYLFVDALDECVAGLPDLLDFIVHTTSREGSRVKWIVSSRNWPSIEEHLERAGHKVKLSLELNAASVSTAVRLYIQYRVAELALQKNYDKETQDAVLAYLFLHANNTFLWAALVCQNLAGVPKRNVIRKLNAFPPGLDALYQRMMHQIGLSDDADLCRRILASVSILYRPVTLEELASLVEELEDIAHDLEQLQEIIGQCGSLLTIRDGTIYFVHQSAKDFLLKETFDILFPSGIKEAHRLVFSRSLLAISKTLQRDIYNLGRVGYPIEQIKVPSPDPLVPSRYSCVYWIDHLCDWSSSINGNDALQDGDAIDSFLRKKYLYWLEALSFCKSISKGVVSMAKLEGLIHDTPANRSLREIVQDSRRFIMDHKWAIENDPLQVYASALMFTPTNSLLCNLFQKDKLGGISIKPTMRNRWSGCLQTYEGHYRPAHLVAFSHDSTRLVSASNDGTVKIWDVTSAECISTLKISSYTMNTIAISPDLSRLAGAETGQPVKILDTYTGQCLRALGSYSHYSYTLVFSHDSKRLALSLLDDSIAISDTSTGECLVTLEGHSDSITSVTFSHDSTRLASTSVDRTVKIWDTCTGRHISTLSGHKGTVNSVAFSHDSTRLASSSADKTIRIWGMSTNECILTLDGHGLLLNSVAFSHDSTLLASDSSNTTVKIWDPRTGKYLSTLKGHSGAVNSVAFSHDSTRLAIASFDKTVKVWDTDNHENLSTFNGHNDCVYSMALFHDSTRLVSASSDWTIKIWDTRTCECLLTLKGHNDSVYQLALSHNSTRLASASRDTKIMIWDTSTGVCLFTLEAHVDFINSMAFSHDSTRLVSTSMSKTIKIWDTYTYECVSTLEGQSRYITSVAFSQDLKRLACASRDQAVKILDASTGECLSTLESHSQNANLAVFSPDSTLLASSSYSALVKIWDVSSGKCLTTFKIGKKLQNISFDTNNSYLKTDIGMIDIRSLSGSRPISARLGLQSPRFQGLALSADGVWITYNSENLVWIPSEYRPACSAASGSMIGIGGGSGIVWICEVQSNMSPTF